MKLTQVVFLSFCLFFLNAFGIQAQEVSLKLGASEIGLNQYFTISISIANDNIRQHSVFPDIDGFAKRGTSSSSNTTISNGKVSSSHTITQNYQPSEKGKFTLEGFRMKINDKEVSSGGMQITVGEPVQQQRRSAFGSADPFDSFYGRNEPTEFVDVKADAFLSLSTNKNEVYVGEGFTTTLAFYVSESNRADMRFFELGKQVTEIVKKIKPERCWEENYNIENINGEQVVLSGKRFTRYTVYQAAFFPLNVEDILLPSVDLKLIKYNVAKNPSFFGQNRQEDFETFRSTPKAIKVKPLPPHPLKEKVAVGQYQLREKADRKELVTGESFSYEFEVLGAGNISAINKPEVPDDEQFDFYEPDSHQNVNRGNGRITGSKSFNYYGIPTEPGTYNLGDYFQWIYFDPIRVKYDTLRSELTLNVSGESRQNEHILSNDVGPFYDRINSEDNSLRSLNGDGWLRIFVNIFIVLSLALTTWLIFRKTS